VASVSATGGEKKLPHLFHIQSIGLWPTHLTELRCRCVRVGAGLRGFARSGRESLILKPKYLGIYSFYIILAKLKITYNLEEREYKRNSFNSFHLFISRQFNVPALYIYSQLRKEDSSHILYIQDRPARCRLATGGCLGHSLYRSFYVHLLSLYLLNFADVTLYLLKKERGKQETATISNIPDLKTRGIPECESRDRERVTDPKLPFFQQPTQTRSSEAAQPSAARIARAWWLKGRAGCMHVLERPNRHAHAALHPTTDYPSRALPLTMPQR
jgi:hypothetical protein